MDDEAARKAERVKALLAGYYGAGGDQPGAQAGEGSIRGGGARKPGSMPAQPPAVTFDSPSFDANMHLVHMLKTSSLERLMVEHRSTAREIKNLDADMQQLVTENYNKFISATDTIRTMKGEIDQAIPELNKLTTIMNNVTECSTSISSKLQARQDKMEELYRVQSLLKRLQAVFDLPKRMRAALEEDVLDAAVSFYAEAQPLLKKYGAKGTFKHIASDADLVAKEISQVLKKRLADRKDDTEQCVLLLRKLGEPDDTLQDRYLAGRAARLRKILKDATAVVQVMAAAAAPGATTAARLPQGQQVDAAAWGFSENGQPPGLKAFVRALDQNLINAVQETVSNVMRFFMTKDLDEAEAAAKRKPLVALAQEVFADYFTIVKRALADYIVASAAEAAGTRAASLPGSQDDDPAAAAATVSNSWGTDLLAQALATVSTDVGMVASGLPELSLRERAASLVASAVQHHVDTCFAAVRHRILTTIDKMVTTQQQQQQGGGQNAQGGEGGASGAVLKRSYALLVSLLGRGLESVMTGLKVYESHPRLLSACYGDFMSGLQGSVQHWFLDMLSSFLAVSGVRYDGSDLMREALKQPATSQTAATATASTKQEREGADAAAATTEVAAVGPGEWQASPHLAALLRPVNTSRGGDVTKFGGLLLMLAKLCTYLEQSRVPWVMEVLAGFFAGRSMSAGSARSPDAPPAFIPGEVARRLAATSAALLAAYVELHGRQLSLMVRRSVAATSWLTHREPRNPRPVCDLICERMGRAESEVVQLVEDTGRRTDVTAGTTGTAARNERGFAAGLLLETGNVERNLAKIFREKVKVFGAPVQFTQAAILGGIAGVGLKSLVECIRLQTLGRAGLQQLQLDCHYLRPQLRRFTGGRTQQVVDSLLDEVVSAGVERSIDPTLLEAAVLERILSSMDGN